MGAGARVTGTGSSNFGKACKHFRGGGGGVIKGGICVFQILYEIFVRNLFSVFKDLHGYSLGCAPGNDRNHPQSTRTEQQASTVCHEPFWETVRGLFATFKRLHGSWRSRIL